MELLRSTRLGMIIRSPRDCNSAEVDVTGVRGLCHIFMVYVITSRTTTEDCSRKNSESSVLYAALHLLTFARQLALDSNCYI